MCKGILNNFLLNLDHVIYFISINKVYSFGQYCYNIFHDFPSNKNPVLINEL